MNQVVFVALAYTLLQLFLREQGRAELTRRTRPRVRDQLLPSAAVILIYCQQRFATLTPLEYTELLLTLVEPARRKILTQARRLRRELLDALPNPRPPVRGRPAPGPALPPLPSHGASCWRAPRSAAFPLPGSPPASRPDGRLPSPNGDQWYMASDAAPGLCGHA